jgi:hypothetical protein
VVDNDLTLRENSNWNNSEDVRVETSGESIGEESPERHLSGIRLIIATIA